MAIEICKAYVKERSSRYAPETTQRRCHRAASYYGYCWQHRKTELSTRRETKHGKPDRRT